MKKRIILNLLSIVALLFLVNCQKDDLSFGDINSPSNLQIMVEVVGKTTAMPFGDGSGKVNFVATASNAISYKYSFSDATSENVPSGIFQKRFTRTGVFKYNVTVVATGKGGVATSKIIEVEVLSTFTDAGAVEFLTGGTQKTWYFSASELGHLGVGPNSDDNLKNYYADYYNATPFEKSASTESSCLYENKMKFSLVNGILKYELDNNGKTFFNAAYQSVGGGSAGYDFCYPYNASGLKTVTLAPSESKPELNKKRGTVLNFSDNGFMGYYVGNSSYDIMSITANRMVVRVVQGNNPALAWYHFFTTIVPVQDPVVDYTNLVFQDEFNIDGAPDATKWGYDLGAGGWGNAELQNYTNSVDNVVVQGGNLKITAKKQTLNGSNYTSARLKTQNKFAFKYGKVEVRAKLPVGGGTWPAIWMLGSSIATVTWPNCGEIDIMEHKGNFPDVIHGSLHYPGNSGGNANTNTALFSGAQNNFKVYKVLWTPNSIKFYVDNALFHSFVNNGTVPFNANFFLLLNVAMGGTFGGNVDPAFTQSAMEVDYVRVYQ